MEAYTGIVVGIILGVLPMTWWLRLLFFVMLWIVCIDFCWRSPFTYRWNKALRGLICLGVFCLIGWKAMSNVAAAYHEDHFPSNVEYMERWGGTGTPVQVLQDPGGNRRVVGDTRSKVTLDGSKMQRYAKDYRFWVACLHDRGMSDPKDLPLSESGPFDIEPGNYTVYIPWSKKFIDELAIGMTGTSYYVLLVPKTTTVSSFATIREAVDRDGAVILENSGGPP